MKRFPLPDGKELFTNDACTRGVVKAPFGCRRVHLRDAGAHWELTEVRGAGPGESPESALGWIAETPPGPPDA